MDDKSKLYDRLSEGLEESARLADLHADAVGAAGDDAAEARERAIAEKARRAAQRARAAAVRLRANGRHDAG